MKKSLKLLVLPAAILLSATNLTSCAPSTAEIAMISDVGDIDDGSFNQGCWEAIQKYGREKNHTFEYYRPFADSEFARECAVKQAVSKGAKFIILPGFKFKTTALTCSNKYKDVKFLLADQNLDEESKDLRNLVSVTYEFEHSGWLAGYAVAKDYFLTDWAANGHLDKQYGFAYYGGMPFASVYPYGYGYIQGILYAAQEFCTDYQIKVEDRPFIDINYSYASVFIQDDMACAMTKGWLSSETTPIKCVFSCGGKLYQSVVEAVKHYNQHSLSEEERDFEDQKAPRKAARWIGVDADQYNLVQDLEDKKSLYTSALKDIGHTIHVILDYFYADKWDLLREQMPETKIEGEKVTSNGGFVQGLKSRFVQEEESLEKNHYDYVGIPENTKKDSDVLISFNKLTKTNDLEPKIELLASKSGGDIIRVYTGFVDKLNDETTQEEEGLGSGVPEFFNGDEYRKSEFNVSISPRETKKESYEDQKYPKDKYKVHVI